MVPILSVTRLVGRLGDKTSLIHRRVVNMAGDDGRVINGHDITVSNNFMDVA
jgi:hypothetical protein